MTRQEQNIILAGLAAAVAILAGAWFLVISPNSDSATVAVGSSSAGDAPSGESPQALAGTEPLAPEITVEAEPIETTTTTVAPPVTEAPTTTVAPTTITLAPTTTTTAPTTTAAPTTETTETTATPDTTDGSDTTAPAEDETTTTAPPTTEADDTGDATTTTVSEQTSTTVADAPVDAPPANELSAIEIEIVRLTNELRTNPNGPLAREGAVIDCDGRILLNEAGDGYAPIGAVEAHLAASLQVARPWSAQMTRDNFVHQDNAGVPALQAAGVEVRSAGENIAWHTFPDIATTHFEGWRESDGHFCNLMDPGFTFIGVGEVTKDGTSFATQNFFSTR